MNDKNDSALQIHTTNRVHGLRLGTSGWVSSSFRWASRFRLLLMESTVGDLSSTILNGLCSFMLEEWKSPIGYSGSIQADSITRKKLAKESGLYNLEKYPIFMELFPGN